MLDTASTTHLITNKNLVNNIKTTTSNQGVISNGGTLDVSETATMTGIGKVPFSEDGIANLLSMAKLVDAGFRVFIDTAIEDAILLYTKDGRVIKFNRSKNIIFP